MASGGLASLLRRWVCLASLGALSACSLLLGLEDRKLDPEAAGSTSGVGPGGVCDTPGDCPVAGNACFVRICAADVCGLIDAPEGTLVTSQKKGDCRRVVCDVSGKPVEVADPMDPFDDGRTCTVDFCDGTNPTHKPASIGIGCEGGHICNDIGGCVECLVDDDCSLDGKVICDDDACVPNTCKDGMLDGSESDLDCGGKCKLCADGKICKGPSDCSSGVCTDSICQVAICSDAVKNGTESDVDCGGFECLKCADGLACGAETDCMSGVCGGGMVPTCQAPTCTDGVQNGDELAIDCAGSNCNAGSCDDGEACSESLQCQSGVCLSNVCQAPTCTDLVKNGTEEDVDCGGPCPACMM